MDRSEAVLLVAEKALADIVNLRSEITALKSGLVANAPTPVEVIEKLIAKAVSALPKAQDIEFFAPDEIADKVAKALRIVAEAPQPRPPVIVQQRAVMQQATSKRIKTWRDNHGNLHADVIESA